MRGAAALLVLAALLSSCGGGAPPAVEAPGALPSALPAAAIPDVPPAETAPSPPPPPPETLKAMTGEAILALLGPPDLERRDPPAAIWQYRTARCTLDVFIYDLGDGGKAAHSAVRNARNLDEAGCLAELLRRRQP